MRTLSKPMEAATVLVRIGGVLQICCNSTSVSEPTTTNTKTYNSYQVYQPLVYDRRKYINAPGPVNLHGQYDEVEEIIQSKSSHKPRNLSALRLYRVKPTGEEIDMSNILKYQNVEISSTINPIEYSPAIRDNLRWMWRNVDLSSSLRAPGYYTATSTSSIPTTSTSENSLIITEVNSIPWGQKHWVS